MTKGAKNRKTIRVGGDFKKIFASEGGGLHLRLAVKRGEHFRLWMDSENVVFSI